MASRSSYDTVARAYADGVRALLTPTLSAVERAAPAQASTDALTAQATALARRSAALREATTADLAAANRRRCRGVGRWTVVVVGERLRRSGISPPNFLQHGIGLRESFGHVSALVLVRLRDPVAGAVNGRDDCSVMRTGRPSSVTPRWSR